VLRGGFSFSSRLLRESADLIDQEKVTIPLAKGVEMASTRSKLAAGVDS
jgi:hypothetical protein